MFLLVIGWALVDIYLILVYWKNSSILKETVSNFLMFAVLATLGLAFL